MSTPFSFSAPHHTKEDEKRELAELTEEEKERILDDIYGRKATRRNNNNSNNNNNDADASYDNNNNINENNNNDNDDSDITDELLRQFDLELESQPRHTMIEYMMACVMNPDVVINETDEKVFLRCCNYDPKLAARRLGDYWKMRLHLFGKENAFNAMTLRGAMKDVVSTMVQIPNWVRILPDDEHGRTVICIDKTNVIYKDQDEVSLIKIMMFVFHLAAKRRSTQVNGIVLVTVDRPIRFDMSSFNFIKLATDMVLQCLPIRLCCVQACSSSLLATCVAPIYKFCMSRDVRQRFLIHTSICNPTLLSKLETFGLQKKNLPKSIGGNYNEQPLWLSECKQIIKEQQKQIAQRHSHHREKRQRET